MKNVKKLGGFSNRLHNPFAHLVGKIVCKHLFMQLIVLIFGQQSKAYFLAHSLSYNTICKANKPEMFLKIKYTLIRYCNNIRRCSIHAKLLNKHGNVNSSEH